jgi:uncharacterized protein with HEPN domain
MDIIKSSTAIDHFIVGLEFEDYEATPMVRSAVERQLQILTEAAFRLGEIAAILCPSIDWRNIRGLGNFLRHQYDAINDRVIWDAIHHEIPLLKLAVARALQALESTEE